MDDVNGISLEAGIELWALPLSPLEEIEEDEVELRTGTSRGRICSLLQRKVLSVTGHLDLCS